MFKIIAAALLAAMTSCVSAFQSTPRQCSDVMREWDEAQTAQGRKFMGAQAVAPGVLMGVYTAPNNDQFAMLIAYKGAPLLPDAESPFKSGGVCIAGDQEARYYFATFPTQGKL